MLNIKTLYFKNLVDDLIKHRRIVGICIVICAAFFAVLGYKNAQEVRELSAEQQVEIQEYNERLAEYDAAIVDTEKALEMVNGQVEEQQEYVDNSIYMKLDSQNIQVASAQYGVQTSGNVGNILNSIFLFINDGGLKEALEEEYGVVDAKYWREIITANNGGNVLNLVVYHYDSAEAEKILNIVKKKLEQKLPDLIAVQGEFTLVEQGTSYYTKADSGVLNTQNGHLNNLKNYTSNRSDFETKLANQKNTKENYIKNNEPDTLEASQPNVILLTAAYLIVGVLFGIAIPVVCFFLQYILSNRLRRKEELKDSGLNVLASYSNKKGHQPSLDRSVLDLKLLAEEKQIENVFISVLQEDEVSKKTAEEWSTAIAQNGMKARIGYHLFDSAEELKALASGRGCLVIAETGKSTYPQLEQQMKLCDRFKVELLGCVVIE